MLPTGSGVNWGPKRYPNIVAHLTEDPPAHFREVAVSRDARGTITARSSTTTRSSMKTTSTSQMRSMKQAQAITSMRDDGIVAFDLGIKTLATG